MTYTAGVITKPIESVQEVWFAFAQAWDGKTLVWTKTHWQGHTDKKEAVKDMHEILKDLKAGQL